VYQKDMPPIIPKRLFLQHAIKMVYTATQWILRACLASFIWLGMVPYITVWIWRLHFWCIATISHLHATHTSDTATRKKEGVLNTILYDCFQGWLLDIGIIVILIVGFLLREWVLQNVPTEFHDLEDLQDEPVQAVVDHPVAQQQQRIEQEPIIEHRHGEEDSMPRDRMNHARRPPLLQEPSNYENLEAMWLMNERQASPPRRNLEYQLDDSESEDEQTSPERIQEMLDSIREEHRLAQEAQQFDHLAIQPGINNDGPINDRPLEEANINEGIEHMDDILEVVGLRGSIRMLLQNSGLMILLYTLCLSVGAWLPYVLGVFFIKVSQR
jgi:E3 ubiquitin-protein ligase DOA10